MQIATQPPVRPRAYENTDGRPSWSPDGSKVAAELGRDIVVVSREDASVETTLGPEGAWSFSPDWHPDGSKVVYGTYTYHEGKELPNWGIHVSNPDGSESQVLAEDGWEPEWNPQGTKIAFHRIKGDDQIAVMDADGSNQTHVSQKGILQRDLSWDPRGQQIVYETWGSGGVEIRVCDTSGEKDRSISNGEGIYHDANPEWSPDGSKVLIERHDPRFPINDLWVVDPETRKDKRVLGEPFRALDATWSPDGSKIAFVSNRDGGRDLDLYVMNADGTGIEQMTDLIGDEHAPSWSPDGNALAFNRIDWTKEKNRDSFHILELSDGTLKETKPSDVLDV